MQPTLALKSSMTGNQQICSMVGTQYILTKGTQSPFPDGMPSLRSGTIGLFNLLLIRTTSLLIIAVDVAHTG